MLSLSVPTEFGGQFNKAVVGLPPSFLSSLLALANFMRLSLMKAAYANMVGYLVQETRVARLFRPMYAEANMGHPSGLVDSLGF
jgi:hypothetical protein